jgi:hypothetical protein
MRLPRRLVSLLPLLLVAACASSPDDTDMPGYAPQPMGELARQVAPAAPAGPAVAIATVTPAEIEHAWTDARGRHWAIAFRCRYATDDAHELLAAACVRTNWLAACERTLATCQAADLDTFAGIAACEERLCQQLGGVLFPCEAGPAVADVTSIEWTMWRVL